MRKDAAPQATATQAGFVREKTLRNVCPRHSSRPASENSEAISERREMPTSASTNRRAKESVYHFRIRQCGRGWPSGETDGFRPLPAAQQD